MYLFSLSLGDESASVLSIGPDFTGFMDELRIQRDWVEKPDLAVAEKSAGSAFFGPIDLKADGAVLTGFDADYRTPGNTGLDFYVLQSELNLPPVSAAAAGETGPAGSSERSAADSESNPLGNGAPR